MTTPLRSIPTALVHARLDRLRGWLAERGVDAFVVVVPENVAYLSGWRPDVEPWERPVALLLPLEGEPVLVLHELSEHALRMARERGALAVTDATFYVERPAVAGDVWSRSRWGELVATRLLDIGVAASARLACDAPGGVLDEVTRHAPGLSFEAAGDALTAMRAVKAPQELALMQSAAALTDYGQVVFRDLARRGALIAEVDAETTRLMRVEGAERFPAADLSARCFSLTGPDSAAPHGTGTGSDARIARGHGIVNILVVSLGGYFVENERTLFVGEPSEAQRSAYACALEAQAAAVAACRPGLPLAGIDRAALEVIERHGFAANVFHRAGHGIGLRGHDRPEDMAFNERPLLAGEVYTIEPGIYLYGVGGFRIDDTVVVGEPPLSLTTTPRELEDVTLAG